MASQENFYTILGCSEASTYKEIKRNYQQLAKQCHPDKRADTESDQFLAIDKAWKTLRDEESRRKYDASLMQDKVNEQFVVYAKLNSDDLEFDGFIAYYPCRCGNSYTIDKRLIESQCAIECEECSNVIVVTNKT